MRGGGSRFFFSPDQSTGLSTELSTGLRVLTGPNDVFFWALLTSGPAALALAVWCAFRMRTRHRHRALEKKLAEFDLELIEALDRLEKLTVQHKRKLGRDAARSKRSEPESKYPPGVPDPEVDPEGWKREMMKRHRGLV